MSERVGFEARLPLEFDPAVARVREALKTEGFGILSTIDLQAAFREKLGRDFRPYVILGACNPPLAFAAVSADPAVGLLLPCNVTVEADPAGGCTVRLTDPVALLRDATAGPELQRVAEDARERLLRVHAALAADR